MKTSEQIWQSHETLMATCCKICLPCLHVITSWGLICPKITFLGGISAPSHELMIRAVIKIFYHLVSSLLFFGFFFFKLTFNTQSKLYSWIHRVTLSDMIHESKLQRLRSSDVTACGSHGETSLTWHLKLLGKNIGASLWPLCLGDNPSAQHALMWLWPFLNDDKKKKKKHKTAIKWHLLGTIGTQWFRLHWTKKLSRSWHLLVTQLYRRCQINAMQLNIQE